jgi:periplasmic protein TonB
MQSTYDSALDEDSESQTGVWLKRAALVILSLLLLVAIGYGLKSIMSGGDSSPKKKITTIALKDLPPPPPPPPKEQPKEQPKDQPKEIKEVQQPKPVEAPPTEVLKMDGPAGDGPSAFAAGNPTSEYKGEELGNKTIGGGVNKNQFNWYTGLIKERIEDAMTKDKALASGAYKVVVKVWIASSGQIQRYELTSSTGDDAIDSLIKKALDGMPAISEAPPSDMPQPVKLRVTARSIG